MASYDRVTKERFDEMKAGCDFFIENHYYRNMKQVDEFVAKTYKVGLRTATQVRLSKDYQEYCEARFRYHNHPYGKGRRPAQSTPLKYEPVRKYTQQYPLASQHPVPPAKEEKAPAVDPGKEKMSDIATNAVAGAIAGGSVLVLWLIVVLILANGGN